MTIRSQFEIQALGRNFVEFDNNSDAPGKSNSMRQDSSGLKFLHEKSDFPSGINGGQGSGPLKFYNGSHFNSFE